MEITIHGNPDEIAALVIAIQERRTEADLTSAGMEREEWHLTRPSEAWKELLSKSEMEMQITAQGATIRRRDFPQTKGRRQQSEPVPR